MQDLHSCKDGRSGILTNGKEQKGRPAAAEKTTPKGYKVKSTKEAITLYWNAKVLDKTVSLVQELVRSPATLQTVFSCVIKNHADTPLSTSSRKKKLIHTSAETSTSFTYGQLFRFQADLGLSTRQTRVHAHDFRVATGLRKAVGDKFRQGLTKNSHYTDDCFKELKTNYLKFDKGTKVGEHFKQSNIVCSKFVDLALRMRLQQNCESLLSKVGIDDGVALS